MADTKNPLISVIIPVYDCEQYLESCLDSVLSQTMTDIEIICIDDGSHDKSGIVLDRYAKLHANIKAVHKKNAGVSAARNDALSLCRGDYVMFCDSDDTMSPDMCQRLYDAAIDSGCDIVRCGYRMHKPGFERICLPPVEERIYNKNELTEQYLMHMIGPFSSQELNRPSLYSANLWCHLIKRELISDNNITFPTSLFSGEDTMFIMECLFCANSMTAVSLPLYNYLLRDGSAVRRFNPKIVENIFRYIDQLDSLTKKYNLYEKTEVNRQFNRIKYANYLAENILNRNNPACMKEKITMLSGALKSDAFNNCFEPLKLSELSPKIRIFYHCLIHKNSRAYHFLRNLRSRLR